MKRIIDINPSMRPRELLIKKGAAYLTDEDLLTIFLGKGVRNYPVNFLVKKVFCTYRHKLLDIDYSSLSKIKGFGIVKALSYVAAREFFFRLWQKSFEVSNIRIVKPEIATKFFIDISFKNKENLVCLFLNSRFNLIRKALISVGTVDSNLFHPREIMEKALRFKASSIIVGHNHPSGELEPSAEDLAATKRIMRAGSILGITLLDHIIVSKNSWKSIVHNKDGKLYSSKSS